MLVILGAGGQAREVCKYLLDMYAGIGVVFMDDSESPIQGLCVSSRLYKVFKEWRFSRDDKFIPAIGDPMGRKIMVEKALSFGLQPSPPLIHPLSSLGGDVGMGCVVSPHAFVSINTKIGDFSLLNYNCTVGHDSIIGRYCTVGPGSAVSGNVTLGDCVYLGANSSIKEKITITNEVTIGMGAAVLHDINSSGTYVGVPAKERRKYAT